ncbi:hypothetical protein BCON_0015g00500 [Botryotinia convoluta]|uniref:Uncharacterized protein n=1 Tax=Botryotinia convoluta TaxID=54673 RepID=A0A4Z1INI0_9HELO|nr:hypothetical protein BCON_0015g00500 [Botryotinia convoluta]
MDGLSSASAVFAVVSIAVQLAETIHKLVDFWKAVEDAPDNIASIFRELELLSKILTQSYELAQLNSFPDIFDEALKDCCSKILKLHSKVEDTRNNLNSSKLRKRKWAAWKIVLQKAEIDSLQKSISEAKTNILHIQVNSLLARPTSVSNVYQIFQQSSELSTQIPGRMQITEQQLAKILIEKHNLLSLSAGCHDEKLAHFRPDIAGKQLTLLDNGEKHDKSPSGYADIPRVAIESRKRSVYGSKGRKVTSPFSNIWTVSRRVREQIVHSSGTRDIVEAESQLILYPSRWLTKFGMAYGVKLSVLASRGWQYSFQPFRAVPESALIFEFCRRGNLDGIRTLLSRGDASPYDRDPLGRTPLWYAVFHHQLDISALLLLEGADAEAMDWAHGRKPIENLYFGTSEDAKLKLELANLLAHYDCEDDSNYWSTGRLLLFYRPNKNMSLDVSTRHESTLLILQYMASFFHRTKYNFSGLFSDLLAFGYEGPVLQWPLRFIPGKFYNGQDSNILQSAIRTLLMIREPLTMKVIIDKSTTTDLHFYVDPTPSQYYRKETPTSLAMYDLEGFLIWRRLLKELGFDISAFVARELETGGLKSIGWTRQTLIELFYQDFTSMVLPKPSHSLGYRHCDRCGWYGNPGERQKVDLEWRRILRLIRTGKNHVAIVDDDPLLVGEKGANTIDRTDKDAPETISDPLPCRFVCQNRCEDNLRVAWEDEGLAPLNFPRYIPKEERERLKKLRLAEEEAKCPTYTMPGAFSVQ